ncbi:MULTISPECIES: P-II family nitrogen regulator [Jonquetella]|uniref:Nitrogen regulatory protein PII n=1 Tax=Jonquetella anthropi DSM 22815 TaxID=885272 RepID=H0UJB4_9BACT|nr:MULTISPECIES: P-II family nitrogen regulator [Jonquetella]EEX49090.1 PII family protein [Jonquetella anthropi E3_33 E1]EHM13881.1 nitrogen regulatory protein PII [Jonquetella anthropi DSM 22815]ERL24141.1 nitrogen regulatory protein P-II [Jonquetella sp. BV3C21]
MELLVIIVERGKADTVVQAANAAGAFGATTLYGRGAPSSEIRKFLSFSIESSKELIFMLITPQNSDAIIKAVTEAGQLNSPGRGIAFTVPVNQVVGLSRITAPQN